MLFSTRPARWFARAVFAVLATIFFGVPLLTLLFAAVAKQWNGVFLSRWGPENLLTALEGSHGRALVKSLLTAGTGSLISIALGTWGALAARHAQGMLRRFMDSIYIAPIALPTVTVGLALLVAFSRPPFVLNGTPVLVLIAHIILITAYTYTSIHAGLARLPESYEQVAASLGGSRSYVLRRVTLPLLRPYFAAAASLSFAFSMGELGATIMVYPPGWVTAPVEVYALTNRGSVFTGAALSVLLLGTTVSALILLNRIGRSRSTQRHSDRRSLASW